MHIVMAYLVRADIVIIYNVMACLLMDYKVMAYMYRLERYAHRVGLSI